MSRTNQTGPQGEIGPLGQRIVRTLHEIGEPLTFEDLAEECETSLPSLQSEVDELIGMGLVEEINHLHVQENREKRVGLTVKGYRTSYPQTEAEP